MTIVPATAADLPGIDALLDAAFGTDRRGRTAYALRAGTCPIAGLSLVARDGERLLGSVQCWPIELAAGDAVVPLTLLGPVAVAAEARRLGLGGRLVGAALDRADAAGCGAMLLIGDLDYYGRFGFSAARTGGWSLPGPVERHRLLLRAPDGDPLPAVAVIQPRSAVARLAA